MKNALFRSLCGLLVIGMVPFAATNARADTVDFDDLTLSPESYWEGPASNGYDEEDPWGGMRHVGTFQSGSVEFVNRYNSGSGTWGGFAYSNTTDVTTAGYTNQFSAYAGSGYGPGEDNYGVVFGYADFLDPTDEERFRELPYMELPNDVSIQSAYVTNTTYVALSMLQGDGFSKKFGGASGNDPDWFKLTAYGTDASGSLLPNTVEFYLADFRFSDNVQDYILDQWTPLDLSPLAGAKRLHFNLTSSDADEYWGMNTPGYFAIDNIVIDPPAQPSTVVGRHVFYANSSIGAAGHATAIATDKTAVLPGETATFENYTSYPKGINGIVIDVDDLPAPEEVSVSDFKFRVGNDNNVESWSSVAAPDIDVQIDGGVGGADRITLVWPDGTMLDEWLQVTVKAAWLAEEDVFYFGNSVGETGNSGANARVSAADVIGARDHPHGSANPATITDPFDVNRDGLVNALDVIVIRDAANSPLSSLRLIAPPGTPALTPVPEPSAWTLLVLGLAIVSWKRRRQLCFLFHSPHYLESSS